MSESTKAVNGKAGSGSGLSVRNLSIGSASEGFLIVEDISFDLAPGKKLGLVGESGCGKTTLALGLLGFVRPGSAILSGEVRVGAIELLSLDERGRRRIRNRRIAYVPQYPSTALSPGMRIGDALREMIQVHGPRDRGVGEQVESALEQAQLPSAAEFQARYPYQLSGGQQQRVAIALALVSQPSVIVMDEPTTGLDVTTQARLLEVIRTIITERDVSLVYVTHDLGVVRNLVDDVAVMYGGRIVETASVEDAFTVPRHPYTRRLLEAVPRISLTSFQPREIPGTSVEPWDRPPGCPFAPRCEHRTDECDAAMPEPEAPAPGSSVRCVHWRQLPARPSGLERLRHRSAAETEPDAPLLRVSGLRAGYGSQVKGQTARLAVEDVAFDVYPGRCIAIVGESGSGKSTTLRCITGLHVPQAGAIVFDGLQLAARARDRDASVRRRIQLVPQNPDSSLNPRRTVKEIVSRPLRQFFGVRGREQEARTNELLSRVRLTSAAAFRYPRELSGGQRQRVAIARALAAEPDLLLCDEVVAALDVAVQAGILDLLEELRIELGASIVFVSHDLAVVRSISDDVVIMHHGAVEESGTTDDIFRLPRAAYTSDLLAAVPDLRSTDYPQTEAGVAGTPLR